MKSRDNDIYTEQKRMANDIRDGLKRMGVSQNQFCRRLLATHYQASMDEEEEEKHVDRFKKVLNLQRKNLEMIPLYYCFYQANFAKNNSELHRSAIEAAYQFFIELDSRIVAIRLEEGCPKTAMESMYSLFKSWRETAKTYGPESIAFYEHTKKYMNGILRRFLSRWQVKDVMHTQFRKELETLQQHTRTYIDELRSDFNILF